MAQTQPTVPELHQSSIDVNTIIERVKGVATFNRGTVTSIAADRRASLEAGLVVTAVGLATAIGFRWDVITALFAVIIGWVGLTAAIWFIADRFMSTPTYPESFQPLLRTIGYAQAPAALVLIEFIWGLGPLIAGVGTLWSFAATIFAVRHTTQFSYPRSIVLAIGAGLVVNVAGFIVSVITGIDPQIW